MPWWSLPAFVGSIGAFVLIVAIIAFISNPIEGDFIPRPNGLGCSLLIIGVICIFFSTAYVAGYYAR